MAKQGSSLAQKARSNAPSQKKSSNASHSTDGKTLALGIGTIGIDKKAKDVEVIDVQGMVDYTDYIVLMSGGSDRQVSALARHIEEGIKNDLGTPCHGIEGMPKASWVLLDYGDVIVHIFHEHTRPYYDLETLWVDAKRLKLEH